MLSPARARLQRQRVLPQGPRALPRLRRHPGRHPEGLRLLRGQVRDRLPVREVRPDLRPRVQRGRHGERRLRDVPRGVRLPLQDRQGPHRAPHRHRAPRARPHVVRRPGHHEVVERPVAQRVLRRVHVAPSRPPRSPSAQSAWTTFNSLEKSWAYRQDQLPSTHPIMANIRDLEDVEVNFDGITYAKGASVLKQLVAWVGQDAFFAGVAEYMRKHHHAQRDAQRPAGRTREGLGPRPGRLVRRLAARRRASPRSRPHRIETDDAGVPSPGFAVAQEVPAEWPTQRPHRLGIGGYDLVGTGDGAQLDAHLVGVETDIDGELTDDPRARRQEPPRAPPRERRRPRLRQGPPRRGLARDRDRARRPLRRVAPPLHGARGRVGHDARRRNARPRVRRPGAEQHRRGEASPPHAHAAASARRPRSPSTWTPPPRSDDERARRRAVGARAGGRGRQRQPVPVRQGVRGAGRDASCSWTPSRRCSTTRLHLDDLAHRHRPRRGTC